MVRASTTENPSQSVSPMQTFFIHLICGVGLAVGLWVARNFYSINLISDPSRTLRLIWVPFLLFDSLFLVLKPSN